MKPQRLLRTALGVLACAWPAVLYRPTLDNPFVFDDRTTVLLNPRLLDPWDLRAVLFDASPRLAVNLSYALDRGFWGFSSFGFHVTNFVLHLIVVGFLISGLSGAGRSRQRGIDPRMRDEEIIRHLQSGQRLSLANVIVFVGLLCCLVSVVWRLVRYFL